MELFPFPEVREKQDELMKSWKEAISDCRSLVAHAPTGLGKTAATVTPALEHARRTDCKAFFLTPRNSQHRIAMETVRRINERHDESIVAVDLIGKDHLCEADASTRAGAGPDCPRHDETMENHQLTEKARKKMEELKHGNLTAEEVKKRCNTVCPYQILLYMSAEADLIIGDYFHVFHPAVRDIVFEKADVELGEAITIVDEAHNLPSRTRSLFSATISTPLVKRCITEAERFGFYQEQEHLEQLRDEMERMSRRELSQKENESRIEKKDLKDAVDSFHSFEEMIVDLEAVADEAEEEQEKSHCRQLEEALETWKGEDRGFVRCIKRDRGEIKLKYTCLNPRISTEEPLNSSHSSLLMSGTLTPPEMYVDLMGLEKDSTDTREYDSPFPSENRRELVIPTLTTKYEERDDSMMQKYAWYITKSLEEVPGNAAAFFPSYSLMRKIRKKIETRTERKIFMEEQRMDKDEKQELLDKFEKEASSGNGLLMGVAAGSLGEGIDYPGEVLKAAFVIGLPLQRPNLETKALIDFLDEKYGKGWDYGYSYPAMNRAIQAAGRCIRSRNDRGVVVYMDKRYDWSNYRKVFPPDTSLEETRAPWQEIEEFFTRV
ncbi:MAG: ATP-dependent DNA helicase [Candidatus Nanohaloarchaea archaeon]